jgi:hypothetical protein
MAKDLLARAAQEKAKEAQAQMKAEADSLCPPKQTPAPGADSQPVQNATSNLSKGGEDPPTSA